MLDPKCFDQVKRVAAFQPQIQNHEIGLASLDEPFRVRGVICYPNASEVRLLVDQLPETVAQHRMIFDYDDARLSWGFFFWCHCMGGASASACNGRRQVTTVPLALFDCTSHEPPMHCARYCMMRRPIPSEPVFASKPLPLSRTVSTILS